MQRTVAEILHRELFGKSTSLENPNFEYDKVYGCVVSGFPIHKVCISSALISRSQNLDTVVPAFSLDIYHAFIWFENVTRSYWR